MNGSRLRSPSRPSSPKVYNYVLKRPDGVCQVRLDLSEFVTSDGTEKGILSGDCDADKLIVTGANNVNDFGPLCGDLSGQHSKLL